MLVHSRQRTAAVGFEQTPIYAPAPQGTRSGPVIEALLLLSRSATGMSDGAWRAKRTKARLAATEEHLTRLLTANMAFPETPGYSQHAMGATTNVEERLLETLHALPVAQQQEVLDFAEFLRSQTERAPTETRGKLTPLPVLPGRMVPGWKDAVYAER